MAKNKIYIIDVTNRDGVQTSRLGLAKLEKTMINLYLNEMGIFQSEFGFPVTHHETNYLNANIKLAKMEVLKPIILEGWIRAIPEDVEKATNLTKVKHLNLSISTSEQTIQGKFKGKFSSGDVIRIMTEAVDLAKKRNKNNRGKCRGYLKN
jgi:homocitrate synthase NifV